MKPSASQGLWSGLPCSLWDCLTAVAMLPGQQEVVSASETQRPPSTMGTGLLMLRLLAVDLLGKIHRGVKP